jgi:uncharacterized protein YbjT (DUF2867 family)
MILVTGSTGNVGSKILGELLKRHVAFRALVRKDGDVQRLNTRGIEVIQGDMTDRGRMRTVLQGVTHLYLLSATNPQLAETEGMLAEEARNAGVQHIVKQSAFGADTQAHCPISRVHAEAEEAVQASGVSCTILRPNSFMQNFVPLHARTIIAQGTFYEALADARVSHIDTRDLAEVAANILTQPGHEGQTYNLTGPEALSDEQIANMLSTLLGRRVTYTPISDDAMRQGMLAAHMPEWYVDSLVTLYQFYRQGGAAPATPDLAYLLKREPRTMETYLQENIANLSSIG